MEIYRFYNCVLSHLCMYSDNSYYIDNTYVYSISNGNTYVRLAKS